MKGECVLRTRQKQVRCFELDIANSQQYLSFIHKNAPLLQDYLILFKEPIPPDVQEMLRKYQLAYSFSTKELKGKASDQVVVYEALELKEQKETKPLKPSLEEDHHVQIFERHIRSGEEIDSYSSLVFLGNVNNGAKIHSEQNISIYGRCEGIVICMGIYMVLKNVYSSHIAFQGQILDTAQLARINENNKLKLITRVDDTISIKDIA